MPQLPLRRHLEPPVLRTVDDPLDLARIDALRVDLGEDVVEGNEGLAHHADVDLWDEQHDVAGHRRQDAPAEHEDRLGRVLLSEATDPLDVTVRRSDPTERDDIPIVSFQNLPYEVVAQAPSVGVINLDEVSRVHSERRQQGDFLRRIDAIHVKTRIGFRIAQLLGFPQDLLEVPPLVTHLAEDVIGGTVDNARDGLKLIGYEAFFDGADDGDPPAHTGFEANIAPQGTGGLKDFASVPGEQCLIGRDHVLALLQCR